MAERLVNPRLSVAGLTLIRNCHLEVSPSIPSPPGSVGKVELDPSLSSIGQFSVALDTPLEADQPATIKYTITGLTNGSVFAVVMGAATPHRSEDGTYEETITPLADTSAVQFRTTANTDGEITLLGVDDGL